MTKEPVTAKLSPKTKDRLEEYADEIGVSRSEAVDRLLKKGLDVQQSDVRVVPVRTDGSGSIENVQDEVSKAQDEITTAQAEIKQLKSSIRGIGPALGVALVWIGVQTSVGLPGGTPVVAVSGFAVLLIMLYQYYKVMVSD